MLLPQDGYDINMICMQRKAYTFLILFELSCLGFLEGYGNWVSPLKSIKYDINYPVCLFCNFHFLTDRTIKMK